MKRVFARPVVFALLGLAASSASAFCGPPLSQNHWGAPVDYRDPKETYSATSSRSTTSRRKSRT